MPGLKGNGSNAAAKPFAIIPQKTSILSKKDMDLHIKVMQKAVYDDLLEQIRDVNNVPKMLIHQSSQTRTNRERRSPWRRLLPQFRAALKLQRVYCEQLYTDRTGVVRAATPTVLICRSGRIC
jgi:hypothetical protein